MKGVQVSQMAYLGNKIQFYFNVSYYDFHKQPKATRTFGQ